MSTELSKGNLSAAAAHLLNKAQEQAVLMGFSLWILGCWEEPRISVPRALALVRAMREETGVSSLGSGCAPLPVGATGPGAG